MLLNLFLGMRVRKNSTETQQTDHIPRLKTEVKESVKDGD